MPWFITAVTLKKESERIPSHRVFGFFNSYADAWNTIKNNSGDLHECLYKYLVLEYIEEGIHPQVFVTEYYEWIDNKWEYLHSNHAPEDINYVSNWALG